MPSLRSDFLGSGPGIPLRASGPDGWQPFAMVSGEAKIQDAIWMVLTTARGERVMRPDFGCGIHDLACESISEALIGRVGDEVRQTLVRWEPRIELLGITVTVDEKEPNRLLIHIDYEVRTTNSRVNLVYPFYVS